MDNDSIVKRVEKVCCNPVLTGQNGGELVIFLNIADYLNRQQGKGDSARNVVFSIASIITNGKETSMKLRAIRLLDLLVKNCGYPIHLHISRKGFLQVISNQFPALSQGQANSMNSYSSVQLELLMELNLWYHTICQWTPYKHELVYIKHLYNRIVDRGYHFPPLDDEELLVLKPRPVNMILLFAEFNKEQRIILNSQISELRRRGNERDMKAANALSNKLKQYQSGNVTIDAQREILKGVEIWQEDFNRWDSKLQDQLNDEAILRDIKQYNGSLSQIQKKVQDILMEDINDSKFLNRMFLFNDQIVQLKHRFELYIQHLLQEEEDKEEDPEDKGTSTDLDILPNKDELSDEIGDMAPDQQKGQSDIIDKPISNDIVEMSTVNKDGTRNDKDELSDKIGGMTLDQPDKPSEIIDKPNDYDITSISNASKDETTNTEAPSPAILTKKSSNETVETVTDSKSQMSQKSFSNPISLLSSQRNQSTKLMFKPKVTNSAPVTTFAVSTAESSGQFKFDSDSNEITTNFKPFLDSP